MGRKTVALSLDENIYDSYKKLCEKHSIVLSRKVDKFMVRGIEETKNCLIKRKQKKRLKGLVEKYTRLFRFR